MTPEPYVNIAFNRSSSISEFTCNAGPIDRNRQRLIDCWFATFQAKAV